MPIDNAATIDDAAPFLRGLAIETSYVQRGELRGLRCESLDTARLGVLGGVDADMEIFFVNGRMLFTAYVPGTGKAEARGRTVSSSSEERGRRWDNSEEFFSSLRPTSS